MVMEDPESPSGDVTAGDVPAEPIYRYRYVGQTPVQTWYPPRYWRPGEVADVAITIADGQFILTDDPLSNIPDDAPAWEAPLPDAPVELPSLDPDPAAPEAPGTDLTAADPEPGAGPGDGTGDEPPVSLPPDPYTATVTPGPEGA